MSVTDATSILTKAKTTFAEKNHDGRAWDEACANVRDGLPAGVFHLSEAERAEFLEQARYTLAKDQVSRRTSR